MEHEKRASRCVQQQRSLRPILLTGPNHLQLIALTALSSLLSIAYLFVVGPTSYSFRTTSHKLQQRYNARTPKPSEVPTYLDILLVSSSPMSSRVLGRWSTLSGLRREASLRGSHAVFKVSGQVSTLTDINPVLTSTFLGALKQAGNLSASFWYVSHICPTNWLSERMIQVARHLYPHLSSSILQNTVESSNVYRTHSPDLNRRPSHPLDWTFRAPETWIGTILWDCGRMVCSLSPEIWFESLVMATDPLTRIYVPRCWITSNYQDERIFLECVFVSKNKISFCMSAIYSSCDILVCIFRRFLQ